MNKRYEAVFCIFLVALAFLWRDNPHLVYPDVLYLFVCLLGLNLASSVALRLWPARQWASAALIMANCAVITAVLAKSGGPSSNLWVLYLLPVYTVCMLLEGSSVSIITGGAIAFNAAFYLVNEEVWSDAIVFSIAIKSGILVFAAVTTWAIASRERRAEERIESQREDLEELEAAIQTHIKRLDQAQRLAEVGMMSSGVAHDLKSPLMVISATCEMLLKRGGIREAIASDIERIQRAAELCGATVTGVLGQAKDRKPAPQKVDINSVVESAFSMYQSTLADHRIRVRMRLDRGLPNVEVCVYELQRVFLNLMSNAKDAMPEGGTLLISTEPSKDWRPGEPRGVVVTVDDSGSGIPEELLGGLFKPFASTKAADKGTGLGLYLCREIAVRHAGSLTAGNGPSGGARFTLSLPPAEPAPGIEKPEQGEQAMEKTKRVLIVDDDPSIRQIVERTLTGPFEVVTAVDAEEGLNKAGTEPFDLVILDVVMPGKNGFSAAECIRESALTRDIPVLMLTSLSTEEDRIHGFDSGVDSYMTKPFDTNELYRSARKLAEQGAPT